jgi:O-antigen chain-terminating methyltransferase
MESVEQVAQHKAAASLSAPSLAALVASLPEQYQAIYEHPELTSQSARACEDRLAVITAAWDALSAGLKRPARVLDLGCSQGYFSLALAARGANVVGIDHGEMNIAVCKALAAEHPKFQAQFMRLGVEQLFETMDVAKFDLVLGLSVFHHLTKLHGIAIIQKWLSELAKAVPTCIFELALASEPMPWASAQPEDERSMLSGFAFVHELARVPTHLSDVERPLVFASNYAWYLDGHIDTFTLATHASHDESSPTCGGTRGYFMNDRHIAKVYSLRDVFPNLNRLEISNEAEFLGDPPADFAPVPKVLRCGMHDREIWLVRERIPGELLYTMITEGKDFDARRVISDVLKQLVVLESAGLMHNDVKTWNVLVMPDGTSTLIDYGSISASDELYVWPRNHISAFWAFVWCVTTKSAWSGKTPTPPFASPYHLPAPFAQWARTFSRIPASEWSFAGLYEHLERMDESADEPLDYTAEDIWRRNVESYLFELSQTVTSTHELSVSLQGNTILGVRQAADDLQPSPGSLR